MKFDQTQLWNLINLIKQEENLINRSWGEVERILILKEFSVFELLPKHENLTINQGAVFENGDGNSNVCCAIVVPPPGNQKVSFTQAWRVTHYVLNGQNYQKAEKLKKQL